MALAHAGRPRPPLLRALENLATPLAYLATLGGIQVGLLWVFRARFGTAIALLATAGWIGLLALVLLRRGHWAIKQALLYSLIAVSGLGPTLLEIVQRPRLGLTIEHDGLVQTEAAVERLINGQPIYGVDWSTTALAQMPWGFTSFPNPALHHLAYFPLTILAGVPVRLATGFLGVTFDGRIVLLLISLLALGAIAWLPVAPQRRFMIATAVFMSPLITLYLWSGRNDVEFLAFVFLSVALLLRERPVAASAALGTAMAFKPFAFFAAPFLLLALYHRWRRSGSSREILLSLLALSAVPLLTIIPFLLSSPRGFLTDTVLYTGGGVSDAYPIGGYGFGALLLGLQLIRHNTDAFPFALFQLPAMALSLLVLGKRFLARPSTARWMGGYAGLFAAFAFFNRFFNDSYLGLLLTLGLLIPPLVETPMEASRVQKPDELAA